MFECSQKQTLQMTDKTIKTLKSSCSSWLVPAFSVWKVIFWKNSNLKWRLLGDDTFCSEIEV